MKVFNKLSPNDEQLNGFVEGDVETPIAMVNLLKFKEKAEYEDGRDTNLSGAEAYAIYGETTNTNLHLPFYLRKLTQFLLR